MHHKPEPIPRRRVKRKPRNKRLEETLRNRTRAETEASESERLIRKAGRQAEVRVIRACRKKSKTPPWFHGIKETENFSGHDRRGIDAIVDTDVGQFNLQIKTTDLGKRKFLEQRPFDKIIVVVIYKFDDADCIRDNVTKLVSEQRDIILKEQRQGKRLEDFQRMDDRDCRQKKIRLNGGR